MAAAAGKWRIREPAAGGAAGSAQEERPEPAPDRMTQDNRLAGAPRNSWVPGARDSIAKAPHASALRAFALRHGNPTNYSKTPYTTKSQFDTCAEIGAAVEARQAQGSDRTATPKTLPLAGWAASRAPAQLGCLAAGRDLAASASADHADAPICSMPNLATHESHFSSLTIVL